MKYIISVAKTYIHRGRHWHKPSTKKHWFVYYLDEDGRFHSEKISSVQAVYYKRQKLRRLRYYCVDCGLFFLGLVKSPKQVLECPNCGG